MPGKERRRRVRGESMALDTLHIVIGAAVVVMAVISFINPEEYMFFFPVIFLLAAILNLVTGKYRYKRSVRNQKKRSHPRFRWRLEEPWRSLQSSAQ